MSLDKAVLYGKEHRKQYKGAKLYDRSCRNNGSCDHCKSNRLYHNIKELDKTNKKFSEFFDTQKI